jgi:hypothetical protein
MRKHNVPPLTSETLTLRARSNSLGGGGADELQTAHLAARCVP